MKAIVNEKFYPTKFGGGVQERRKYPLQLKALIDQAKAIKDELISEGVGKVLPSMLNLKRKRQEEEKKSYVDEEKKVFVSGNNVWCEKIETL